MPFSVSPDTPQVLCLGEVLWDYLADQPGQSLAEVTSWTPFPGGAPANVACVLATLGTAAGLISCVGTDGAGERLVALLQKFQVNIVGLQRHPLPTRSVYVTRSKEGDRTFAGFGDGPTNFADMHLQTEQICEALFSTADYLVLGTLGLAYPDTCAAMIHALRLAQQHNVNLWVDVNWRPMFWPHPELAKPMILDLLSQAQMIKLSVEEAQWLFNTTDSAVIAKAVPQAGVLVTAGEQGCSYQIAEDRGTVPAFAVTVVDTTGAGDAFMAGLLHQCCQRGNQQTGDIFREMIRYASAVGAITTTRRGAMSVDPTEIEPLLQVHP
ncbi:MAG: carbohydrate kinase [Thermosynechococcaceae cyanobacterium]